MQLHMWCIPVDANHTRMLLAGARDFVRIQPLAALVDRYNTRILHEDRAIVESSHPIEAPPASEERSVGTDRATLAFRRWYHERKKQVTRAAPDEPAATPLAV
jgi:phenylpropionate dioxygenase-like ring-hydroxylating dioxygenase large terminal subunit